MSFSSRTCLLSLLPLLGLEIVEALTAPRVLAHGVGLVTTGLTVGKEHRVVPLRHFGEQGTTNGIKAYGLVRLYDDHGGVGGTGECSILASLGERK